MALKDKLLDKAQKYMLKGNIDKALAEYRSAADIDPRDISIRLRIGDLYVKTNRTEEAIKEYTEVARANAQRGFYPKAIAVYKKVLKLDDSILDVHYKLAELYTKQRLIADAISSYSYIISTFEKLGKTSEVMELLKKMLDIDPDNVGIRLKLADLFLKLSFDKDAVSEYAQIFEKLIAEGKVDRAEKVFLSLHNSRPNEPVILDSLAKIYKSKGDNDKFIQYAAPLLKTYKKNEDVGRALELSKSILEVKPDDAGALEVTRGVEPPELIHKETEEQAAPGPVAVEASAAEAAGAGQAAEEDFSVAESRASVDEDEMESAGEAAEAEEAGSDTLISWPEEDIEISVEGFEDDEAASAEPVEDALKDEEEFVVAGEDTPVEEEAADAEIELDDYGMDSHAPAAPAEEPVVEEEAPVEDFSVAESRVTEDEPVEESAAEAEEAEEPLTAEEFRPEDEAPEDEASIEEPAPAEPEIEEVEEPEAAQLEAAADEPEQEAEVEIDLGDYGMDSPVSAAPVGETVAGQEAPAETAAEEIEEEPAEEDIAVDETVAGGEQAEEIEEEIEEPAEEVEAEEPVAVDEPAVEQEVPAEAAAEEAVEAEEEPAPEEAPAEDFSVAESRPAEDSVEEAVEFSVDEQVAVEQVEEPEEEPEEKIEVEIEEPTEEAEAEEPVAVDEPAVEQEVPAEAAAEEAVEAEEEPAPEEDPAEDFSVAESRPAEDSVEEAVEFSVDEQVAVEQVEEPEEEPEEKIEVAIEEPAEEAEAEEPSAVDEPAVEQEVPAEAAAEEAVEAEEEPSEEEIAVDETVAGEPAEESPAAEIEEQVEEEIAIEEPFAGEPGGEIEEPAVEEESAAEEPFESFEAEPGEPIEERIERVLAEEPFDVNVDVDVADFPESGADAAAEEPVGVEEPAAGADESTADSLESLEIESELSSAIEELQARMDTGDELLEPDKVKVEESAPESEFIDLSAELGMEEALEGLAGTWTRSEGESTETFDEYKDGIGHQLSKEDTETHYNLGIAYMEMELFDEASKEFKIALKEPRLEGDCYARLGLCAMAESKPDEAVMYYLKGLKVEGKSEDERKGMMYELALAYEAAGDMDEAFQLFTSINDLDPGYREVADKLSTFDCERRRIPFDDGLIEVELL